MLPYEAEVEFRTWGKETKDAYRRRAARVGRLEGGPVWEAVTAGADDRGRLLGSAAGYGRFGDPEHYDTLTAETGGRYRRSTDALLDRTTEEQIRLFMCRRHGQCGDDPFEPRPRTALERSRDVCLLRMVPLVAACVAYDQSRFWCRSQGRWHRQQIVRTACEAGEGRAAPGVLSCLACVLVTVAVKRLCGGSSER